MPRKAKSRKGSSGGSRDLLEDPDVKRWYENLRRGSAQTARERLRVLARLGRHLQATPAQIVELAENGNGRELEDRLMDFLDGQLKAGRTPSYLENYLKAARSWLEFQGLTIRRHIRLGDTKSTPSLEDETIPSREELRAILAVASPRGKAVVSLLVFSGLRPGVLASFRGLNGMVLRDLPDLDSRRLRWTRLPAQVRVRRELSKVSYPYRTFLSEEGAEHLLRYLQLRQDGGEELTAASPVIRAAKGFETMGKRVGAANYGSPFVTTGKVRMEVKSAMKKAAYEGRPYVLRRYFISRLMDASWKGEVPRDFVSHWAGRRGDIEHTYSLHKGIPAGLLEEMREAYARAEGYLSTVSLIPEDSYEVREAQDRLAELVERLVSEKLREKLGGVSPPPPESPGGS